MIFASWNSLLYWPPIPFSLPAVFLHDHCIAFGILILFSPENMILFSPQFKHHVVKPELATSSTRISIFPVLISICAGDKSIDIATWTHRPGSPRMLLFLSCARPLPDPALSSTLFLPGSSSWKEVQTFSCLQDLLQFYPLLFSLSSLSASLARLPTFCSTFFFWYAILVLNTFPNT